MWIMIIIHWHHFLPMNINHDPVIKYKILLTNLISFQVHAEEISGNNGYVELSFCAKKLDDKVRGARVSDGNINTVHGLLDVV